MLSEIKSEFWYTGSSLRVFGCDCVTNFEPQASPEISHQKINPHLITNKEEKREIWNLPQFVTIFKRFATKFFHSPRSSYSFSDSFFSRFCIAKRI